MFLFQRGVKLGFEILLSFLNNHDCRKFGRRKDKVLKLFHNYFYFFKKIIKENGTVFQGGTNQKKKSSFL